MVEFDDSNRARDSRRCGRRVGADVRRYISRSVDLDSRSTDGRQLVDVGGGGGNAIEQVEFRSRGREVTDCGNRAIPACHVNQLLLPSCGGP